jgi:hypothetical protein
VSQSGTKGQLKEVGWDEVKGLNHDILTALSPQLNWTASLHLFTGIDWGSLSGNGNNWTGMIGLLADGKADMIGKVDEYGAIKSADNYFV